MPLSPDKQEELKRVTIEYLETLTLIHIWDQREARIGIDYQQYSLMRTFTSGKKDGPHGLFAPIEALETYLSQIGDIGEGRINLSSVNKVIEGLCSDFIVVPLDSKEIDGFADKAVEWLNQAYDYSTTVFIPLANVRISHDVPEITLGRATLHRGYSHSEMMGYVHQLAPKTEFNVTESTCYLKIAATGDAESIEQQVLTETGNALRVLRFVSWTSSKLKGTKRISHNQACDVSYYPCHTPAGYYFYLNRKGEPHNCYLINTTTPSIYHIERKQFIEFQLHGLDNLNSHFANTGNSISEHILLALEWYDSGLQAQTNRDAVYRFLVCLNTIVGWDYNRTNLDSPVMASRLNMLFATAASRSPFKKISVAPASRRRKIFVPIRNYALRFDIYGEFKGLKDLSSWNTSGKPTSKVISKIVGTYTALFTEMYQEQRNPILHGKPHKLGKPISSQDVKNSQLLAQNGLRLVMKLIAAHPDWTTRDEVENWFTSN